MSEIRLIRSNQKGIETDHYGFFHIMEIDKVSRSIDGF